MCSCMASAPLLGAEKSAAVRNGMAAVLRACWRALAAYIVRARKGPCSAVLGLMPALHRKPDLLGLIQGRARHTGVAQKVLKASCCAAGIWACAGGIVRSEGPAALYKGLMPALAGIAPYAAINFATYDGLKAWAYGAGRAHCSIILLCYAQLAQQSWAPAFCASRNNPGPLQECCPLLHTQEALATHQTAHHASCTEAFIARGAHPKLSPALPAPEG